ncbi:dihydrolipoyl dehydrogenase [Actinoplanes sp. NPDC051851]|uniref:dihydrolipoyl dehydrogenase n=1 Tax=Actinoplanes sp. NPDC051851 TaxID=3154753 RepID=UPI0034345E49
MSQPQATEFDAVVLGAGSGGYATALRAAQLGMSVALIERDKIGGTCLHAGCIPTKALLHVAEAAESVRHSASLGLRATVDGVDAAGVRKFTDGVVTRLYRGLQGLVAAAPGIVSVVGAGRLSDSHTVTVDGIHYIGRHLVLATGSAPRTLPGVRLGGRILSSTEALQLPEIPSRVVIIGGSVIGVEFASAWRSLGSEVTIVEALPSLVPQEDPALSRQLERAFRRRKIGVRTGARVAEVEQRDDDATVVLADGEKLDADYVLVAVGRAPVTGDLGLEAVGIKTEQGFVRTDERLRTTVPHAYAVGDLVRGLQLAHRGFAHGTFVAEQIAGLNPAPVTDALIPRVTYCEPELASVGLTESQARERYGDGVRTYEYNLGGNGRSQIRGTTGLVKLVQEPGGAVAGVHMIGSRIGEQVGEASLWVNLGLHPDQVAGIVHAHPTQNEALGEAALVLAGKPLHAHA